MKFKCGPFGIWIYNLICTSDTNKHYLLHAPKCIESTDVGIYYSGYQSVFPVRILASYKKQLVVQFELF